MAAVGRGHGRSFASDIAGCPRSGWQSVQVVRALDHEEIYRLCGLVQPARLATIDAEGYPHITPLWFVYHGGIFVMTSMVSKPHVVRVRANPRAALLIDVEEPERADGERPNMQLRVVGDAVLMADVGGEWTRRITDKYVLGPGRAATIARRCAQERVAILLGPVSPVAIASI